MPSRTEDFLVLAPCASTLTSLVGCLPTSFVVFRSMVLRLQREYPHSGFFSVFVNSSVHYTAKRTQPFEEPIMGDVDTRAAEGIEEPSLLERSDSLRVGTNVGGVVAGSVCFHNESGFWEIHRRDNVTTVGVRQEMFNKSWGLKSRCHSMAIENCPQNQAYGLRKGRARSNN